ncbi:MAG: hypothetical protein C3F11_07970 [Methylocystaceae bacterium]|nr:MAG: hypothetical protein C3F11_07970 [Methylocystaceae bacterium]
MTGATNENEPWLTKERVIAAGIGAVFGGVLEYVFIGQGATIVAALLFGLAGAFVPILFE